MHNKVVYHTMKAFSSFGLPVLRFNFRSVGLSDGIHDEGYGEQEDVQAALKWMEQNFNLPILFAGFSFGSNVGLRACCGRGRARDVRLLYDTGKLDAGLLRRVGTPHHVLHGW